MDRFQEMQVFVAVAQDSGFSAAARRLGLSAASGAIANAWARATGLKPRKFPLYFPVDFTPIPPGKLPTPVNVAIPA